jgi:hypothetical protein
MSRVSVRGAAASRCRGSWRTHARPQWTIAGRYSGVFSASGASVGKFLEDLEPVRIAVAARLPRRATSLSRVDGEFLAELLGPPEDGVGCDLTNKNKKKVIR